MSPYAFKVGRAFIKAEGIDRDVTEGTRNIIVNAFSPSSGKILIQDYSHSHQCHFYHARQCMIAKITWEPSCFPSSRLYIFDKAKAATQTAIACKLYPQVAALL
jgi:hypothetical protein